MVLVVPVAPVMPSLPPYSGGTIIMLRPIKNPFQLPRRLARPQPLWTGTISPSGRFTLGSTPKKLPPNAGEVKTYAKDEMLPVQETDISLLPDSIQRSCDMCVVRSEGGEGSTRIGSSNSAISRKRGLRGCRGIGGAASNQLQYWLTEFERRHGRRNISFLTLTVPEGGKHWRDAIQSNWSRIAKDIVEEIKRELARAKAPSTVVLGCTEIQEKRSKRYGWEVPHLHLVFRGNRRSGSGWIFSPPKIRGIWRRVLGRYVDVANTDFRAAENIQPVKSSCARYLSKYLSKSASKRGSTIPGSGWHPNSYVIMPRTYRRWYRTNSRYGEVIGLHILEVMKERHKIDGFYMRPITLKTRIDVNTGEHYNEVVIGWVGHNPDWVEHPPDSVIDCCG